MTAPVEMFSGELTHLRECHFEMLEALKICVDAAMALASADFRDNRLQYWAAIEGAKAAIARAEGRQ